MDVSSFGVDVFHQFIDYSGSVALQVRDKYTNRVYRKITWFNVSYKGIFDHGWSLKFQCFEKTVDFKFKEEEKDTWYSGGLRIGT